MPIETHSDQMHNIRMVELRHDGCFHQEVRLGLACRQFWQGLHGDRHLCGVGGAVPVQALVYLAEGSLA